MYYLPETISALGYISLDQLGMACPNWPLKLINFRRALMTRDDFADIKSEDFKHVPKNATEAATFLRQILEDRLHFNDETKTWYAWNGIVHAPLTSDTVPLQIIDFLGQRYDELTVIFEGRQEAALAGATDKNATSKVKARYETLGKFASFGRTIQTNKGVKDILDKLKRCPGIAVTRDYFANDRKFLVVRNGVIDLDDYRATRVPTLLEHDAARPVTRYFDAEYDVNAKAVQWEAFLASSIIEDGGDTVKLVQKAVGAAFSAEEKPRALFNLLGAPASGKSVFLSVFNKLGQDYSVMPNNQAIQLNNGDTNFYQDALRNKRFVGFSEVQGKKPLDDGFLKGILGGDEQNTRQMRQMESPWKPQCVLFIASNMPLKFDTRDEATFLKILPIPFPHSFTEVSPEHKMDRELENKVLSERNGILTWVLTGMLKFWDCGLAPTAAVMAAMDGNKTANSHALQFMEAMLDGGHVIQDPTASLSGCLNVGTGYEMFRHWADAQGIKNIPGKQTFSSDVADFYYGKKRSDGVRFTGLFMQEHFVQNIKNGVSHLNLAKNL